MAKSEISFVRLTEVALGDIVSHMSDARMAEHMPLLTTAWDDQIAATFVQTKESCWQRDGLGHWGILENGAYIGWGGFQKEGDDWDFGLVLKPAAFGLGMQVAKLALARAAADPRIPYVTFLLPPSRKNLGALKRLGADYLGTVEYDGEVFRKFRLQTEA